MHLIDIEDKLLATIRDHLDNLDEICTEEMGEVIDMIKDIEAAEYYRASIKKICCECEMEVEEEVQHLIDKANSGSKEEKDKLKVKIQEWLDKIK